jgi:hypothetical protein
MKAKKFQFDKDYLRRCKQSSPETKLQWLAAAVEFAQTKKKIIRK